MTITISDEELEQMVRTELVNRICNEIEENWYCSDNKFGHFANRTYKRELGDAIRKIFKDNQNLVEDAVERASKYLYERGKAEIVKRLEGTN